MLTVAPPALACFAFDRCRLFESTDLDETRELCGRVFNPHQLQLRGRGQALHARMDHHPLGDMSLNRLTWGAAVDVDPERLGTYYLLSLPVQGTATFRLADQVTEVSPACAGIVNASQRFRFSTSQDFTQIVLRVERRAVDAAWQALTGRPVERPIDFLGGMPVSSPAWHALEPVVTLLARCANAERPPPALPLLHARVTEMFTTMLLLHQPHTGHGGAAFGATLGGVFDAAFGRSPHGRAAVTLLKRAEACMEERLDEVLTVSAVARACGVSIRTLQAAFGKAHGCGPMAWLRARRLQAVHDSLWADARARPAIADTALRFGFTHLGEFSRAYRTRFGETPSATLARRG